MSFPRYPKYKDSGVEWLGDVPEHWDVLPLKRSFRIVGGSTPKSEVELFWNGDILWATPGDLSKRNSIYINKTERKITAKGLASCGTALVPPGSIILSTRAPIGSLAITETNMCTNQGCKSLVPAEQADAVYFAHLLNICTTQLNIRGKGATFVELSADELGAFKTPSPPLTEQSLIAIFLDRETTKIDELIAEQKHLIELLKEKRQAVISHAVTKGLNPDAPMKDSGVEWLGDVPVHWEILALKNIASLRSGESITSENISEVGEYPVYGGNGLRGFTSTFTHEGLYALIGRQGALCGNINYADGKFWASEHAVVVSPKIKLIQKWLGELLRTMNLNQYSVSAAQPGLSVEIISNLKIPFPPHFEQNSIFEFLNTETIKLDVLTAEAQRAIDLLQERRSALISAAVTGQIDVRNYTKKEPS